MMRDQRRILLRYSVIIGVVLVAGLALTVAPGGTWWLLGLAAMVWLQRLLLTAPQRRSDLARELFGALAWLLLAFAAVSLLPEEVRPIADLLALLVVLISIFGPYIRRTRF